MIGKLKDILLKDILTTSLIIYCSGWVLSILFYIISNFLEKFFKVYSLYRGTSGNILEFRDIALFGATLFPLMLLIVLINITKAINRLDRKQTG